MAWCSHGAVNFIVAVDSKVEPELQPLVLQLPSGHMAAVRICCCTSVGRDCLFDIQVLDGEDGRAGRTIQRSLRDIEKLHSKVAESYAKITKQKLRAISYTRRMPLFSSRSWMLARCGELQAWLCDVLAAGLALKLQELQEFLGLQNRLAGPKWGGGGPSLVLDLLESLPPVFEEIVSFVEQPSELVRFCGEASSTMRNEADFADHRHWERMYKRKWPTFHESMRHAGTKDWREAYRLTTTGTLSCIVEVFDREKKLGFAMSAMPAVCRWVGSGYVARYLSACEVRPEHIPSDEEYRLRFCPVSARKELEPTKLDLDTALSRDLFPPDTYPYRVLHTKMDEIKPGQPVELQWKMQPRSPFGWWYGVLESFSGEGEDAIAHLSFPHFPVGSRWYYLTVPIGKDSQVHCAMGGYSGGIRAVSDTEKQRWMEFFPKKPVTF